MASSGLQIYIHASICCLDGSEGDRGLASTAHDPLHIAVAEGGDAGADHVWPVLHVFDLVEVDIINHAAGDDLKSGSFDGVNVLSDQIVFEGPGRDRGYGLAILGANADATEIVSEQLDIQDHQLRGQDRAFAQRQANRQRLPNRRAILGKGPLLRYTFGTLMVCEPDTTPFMSRHFFS